MGSLRFWLAMVVAAGHIGLLGGINIAAISLLIFYIISGFTITGLFTLRFQDKKNGIFAFATDRFLRIYPSFWIFCILTLLVIHWSQIDHLVTNKFAIFNNLSLITLNLAGVIPISYLKVINNDFNFLLPQSWSLASELQFYLLVPLLFALQNKITHIFEIIFCISFLIFCCATLGLIAPETYGYRLLPGTLFYFCSGILLFLRRSNFIYKLAMPCMGILFVILVFFSHPELNYVTEGCISFLLGIPLVAYFSKTKNSSKLDYLLGEISYPLYLAHFCVIWFMRDRNWSYSPRALSLIELLLSFCLAYLAVVFVERPIHKLRHSMRP